MTVAQIIDFAYQHGVKLWVEEERLRYDAPIGIMTEERLQALRENKDTLRALLQSSPIRDDSAQFSSFPDSLENWETRKLEAGLKVGCIAFLIVRCANLDDEEVVFAADDAQLPLDTDGLLDGRVVYRLRELALLRQSHPSPDALKSLHAIKKELGGEYIGSKPNQHRESGAIGDM